MKRLISGVIIAFMLALCGSWILRGQEKSGEMLCEGGKCSEVTFRHVDMGTSATRFDATTIRHIYTKQFEWVDGKLRILQPMTLEYKGKEFLVGTAVLDPKELVFLCDGCATRWSILKPGMLPVERWSGGGGSTVSLPAVDDTYDCSPCSLSEYSQRARDRWKHAEFYGGPSPNVIQDPPSATGFRLPEHLSKPAPQAEAEPAKSICGTTLKDENTATKYVTLLQVTCPPWEALAKFMPIPPGTGPSTQVLVYATAGESFIATVNGLWKLAGVLYDQPDGTKAGMVVFDGADFKTVTVSVQGALP